MSRRTLARQSQGFFYTWSRGIKPSKTSWNNQKNKQKNKPAPTVVCGSTGQEQQQRKKDSPDFGLHPHRLHHHCVSVPCARYENVTMTRPPLQRRKYEIQSRCGQEFCPVLTAALWLTLTLYAWLEGLKKEGEEGVYALSLFLFSQSFLSLSPQNQCHVFPVGSDSVPWSIFNPKTDTYSRAWVRKHQATALTQIQQIIQWTTIM